MTQLDLSSPCPADQLQQALTSANADPEAGLAQTNGLTASYPSDPRLHFLRGSLLAGLRRYDEAREAMATALDLAPAYDLARFQLGFLEFTSGRPQIAEAVWAPLLDLKEDQPLRLFVIGLTHLVRDEFAESILALRSGITHNVEIPPLNADMQLIIDQVTRITSGTAATPQSISEDHLLLQQFGRAHKTAGRD